jgi:hypothetical protein
MARIYHTQMLATAIEHLNFTMQAILSIKPFEYKAVCHHGCAKSAVREKNQDTRNRREYRALDVQA